MNAAEQVVAGRQTHPDKPTQLSPAPQPGAACRLQRHAGGRPKMQPARRFRAQAWRCGWLTAPIHWK